MDGQFVIPEAYQGKEWAKDVTSNDQLFSKLDEFATKASTPAPVPQFAVPDSYKDREWVKGIDNPDKLWSKLDGAQQLLGKRPAGIPDAAAPKEQWDAFYKALGRPDTAEAYEFEKIEGMDYNEEFAKTVKGIFHEAGLTPQQAKVVQSKYENSLLAQKQAQDAQFTALADKTFGTNKDKAFSVAKALMVEHGPKDLVPHLDRLSNEQLIIMASTIHSIATKFIAPDKLPAGMDGGGASTIENNRIKAKELMASDAYRDPMHKDHESTIAMVNQLYAPLSSKK